MSSLGSKIQLRRAVGLCVLDSEIFITEAAATPFGPAVLAQSRLSTLPGETLKDAAALLAKHVPAKRVHTTRTGVALPTFNCYCVTYERTVDSRDGLIPEEELRGKLSSASSQGGQLCVEQAVLKIGRRRFSTVMACPRSYISERVDQLCRDGSPALLFQPLPWAVTRAWQMSGRIPGGSRLWVRVSLDQRFGLAVLCHKSRAIGWREFDTASVDLSMGVKKAVLSLLTYARKSLVFETPSLVQIEGDAQAAGKAGVTLEEMGLRVEVLERKVCLGQSASLGIALACLDRPADVSDLARSLRPPPRLRDLIPWGDLAVSAGLVLALWVIINASYMGLRRSLSRAMADSCQDPKLRSCSIQDLKGQSLTLASRVMAFNKFFEERETWSKYLAAVSSWLPQQAYLVDIQGAAPLPIAKEKRDSQRSLVLTCAADLDRGRTAPVEIHEFVESLRHKPLLRRFFPMVELATVRWRKEGGSGRTLFSVACLPKRKFKTIAHEGAAEPGAEGAEKKEL